MIDLFRFLVDVLQVVLLVGGIAAVVLGTRRKRRDPTLVGYDKGRRLTWWGWGALIAITPVATAA